VRCSGHPSCIEFAGRETLGGIVAEVGHGTLTDPTQRQSLELDLLALGESEPRDRGRPVLAIGEAKWGTQLGLGHLRRLEGARELLQDRPGVNVGAARLLLASAAGFSDDLVAAAGIRSDIVLVDLDRLYSGD
jgi:hypothetical protein